jgi:hypothetical protein
MEPSSRSLVEAVEGFLKKTNERRFWRVFEP